MSKSAKTKPLAAGKLYAILGSILQIGPVYAVCYLYAFLFSFFTLPVHSSGLNMTNAMAHMQMAMGMGFIGLYFLRLAFGSYRYREAWVYRCLLASAIVWLLLFPVGTIIGIILLAILFRNRRIDTHTKSLEQSA